QVTFAKLMMLNPVAQIIQDLRHFIVYSGNTTVSELIENPVIVAIPYILPVVVYLLGITVFRKNAKKFAEIL
ncbi:TPA: ABC transporter permease, partial [Streptococcus suis]|nr:ABC transporter permease [Streptococcus suis]